MSQSLRTKVALVTGGGRGLGEAICYTLSRAGATVVVADIHHDMAMNVAKRIGEKGGTACAFRMDVSDEHDARQVVRFIEEQYGRIDIVVNNASVDVPVPFEELSISDWDSVLATNLRGPFVLAKCVYPLMKQQGSGQLINVASSMVKRGWMNATAYHASKWGLVGFSHALNQEAAEHGILVSAVVYQGTLSPALREAFPDIDISNIQDPTDIAEMIRQLLASSSSATNERPEVMVIPIQGNRRTA